MILKRKHLHIVSDEKFIDAAYRTFEEVLPGENEYLIIGKKSELAYVKNAKVTFCRPTIIWILRRIVHLKYKSLILHGLRNEFQKLLVLAINKSIPIFWIGWGYDYYQFSSMGLYKEKTQVVVNGFKLSKVKKVNRSYIKELDKDVDIKKVFERINFFGPVLKSEFKLINDFYPSSKMGFLDWNYLTLEDDIIKGFEKRTITGNNLLLGNSANPVNNQLDALEDILDFKFSYDNILCPLSYGDGRYRDIVVRVGKLVFSGRFKPMTSYMAYQDYVHQIMSCRYVFINSYRQVAMGNILLMLYLGAYVIFEKINPAYAFFIENGIQVFAVDEAKRTDFPEIDLSRTRKKLEELWGRKVIKEKTKIVFDKLEAALRNGI